MNEVRIYGELIWKLVRERKLELIDVLIERLKKEGKIYLLKYIVAYLKEKYNQEKNILEGNLLLAFADEIEKIKEILEKRLKSKIKINKVEIDENLILGGLFVSKNIRVDFSLKNLIKQFSRQWMI